MSAFIIDDDGNYQPVFGAIQTVTLNLEATTTLNSASTDLQAPTAKTVYDFVADRFEAYGTITIDI